RRLETQISLENIYGPTEATVYAAWYSLRDWTPGSAVPIGKPLTNVQLYILDRHDKLQAVGVPGELVITGAGLARGYLNRPQLTAEKFVKLKEHVSPNTQSFPNTQYSIANNHFYRTGDLCRWQPDGNIEFLGRLDHQVKIRGFRIELGEIENRLLKFQGIKEAVVLVKDNKNGDKYLCAYCSPQEKNENDTPAGPSEHSAPGIDPSAVREYLGETLPDYMCPSFFVEVDTIPLTAGGKVDRKKLLEIKITSAGNRQEHLSPRDEIEKKLAGMWQDTLALSDDHYKYGIDDDFFKVGGHSLKATLLAAMIHKAFEVKIPLAELLKNATIRKQAHYIKTSAKEKYIALEEAEKRDYYPLSSAQKGLYYMQQMAPESTSYNDASAFILEGEIDKNYLQTTFLKLIRRHESLRTSFDIVNHQPVQIIHDEKEITFNIDYFDPQDRQPETIVNDFVAPFNLKRYPLFKVGLIRLQPQEHILIIDMHHIITDGFSHNILIKDFLFLYENRPIPPLRIQYKDFSQWQNQLVQSGKIQRQKEYWLGLFKDGTPQFEMSTDYPRPAVKGFVGDRIAFKIHKEDADKLNRIYRSGETTLYMVLLAIYTVLLAKYSGLEDIVVGSPISGRTDAELNDVIGLFVNMLSLRNRPTGSKTFTAFLAEVRQNVLNAFDNQDFKFEELVTGLQARNPARHPVFDVVFAMQNFNTGETTGDFDLRVTPYKRESNTVKFDLLLNAFETKDGIDLLLEYSTELYKKETAKKLTQHFGELLRQIVENINIKIDDITLSHSLLTAAPVKLDADELSFGF
ncbi:MAG: AMP-binding protein, partial [bacterium]|nr:AMP-binding protein [bacterium]